MLSTAPITTPADALAASQAFAYGSLGLLVQAPSSTPLRWLEEFLLPAFETEARPPYAARVCLREDTREYERSLARRPAAAGELDCFINDSHVVRLPAWNSAPNTTTAYQEIYRALFVVDRAEHAVTVLSPAGNEGARTALMRAVRELAMNDSRRAGGLFLHAAALAVDGRGLLIAGEKRAGKTTLLLHLLRTTGADFVSNDRVLLPAPAAPEVRAMPTIVTLRTGTLDRIPGLRAAIESRSFYYRRTVAESAEHPAPARAWPDGSFGLSPAQLCSLLGVAARPRCAPRILLFPRLRGDRRGARLRDLSADAAAERLRRSLLSASLTKTTSELITFAPGSPAPDAEQLRALCDGVAARLPALECELGPDAYDGGSLAADCLRLLDGAEPGR